MSKNCPKCSQEVPDDAKFCMNCGYNFDETDGKDSNLFKNGKIFLILIAIVVIVGALFIFTTGSNNNTSSNAVGDVDHVALTITDVGGWDSDSSSKKSYTLYTQALFNSVPDKTKGYMLKTIYYDKDNKQIGQETESLDYVYYDSDYALSFGHYTTYNKPDPDHVTVQVIKDGKIIDNYTEEIDTSKIDYLN